MSYYHQTIVRPFGNLTPLLESILDSVESHGQNGVKFNEKEGVYEISVNVAGYKKEQLSIEAETDTIIVTANSEKRGKATRSFYVPDIDVDRVEAKLEDGILTVTAFQPQSALPKKIAIK